MVNAGRDEDRSHGIVEKIETEAAAVKNTDVVGGINLNPDTIDLETRGESAEFEIPPGFEDLETVPLDGLSPDIFQIVPAPAGYLPALLGYSDGEKVPPVKPLAMSPS